jgi:hypothetical protein
MLEKRAFNVVFVRESHGVGVEPSGAPDQVVQYSGREVSLTLR